MTNTDPFRLPQHSESEVALLGSIFIDNKAMFLQYFNFSPSSIKSTLSKTILSPADHSHHLSI